MSPRLATILLATILLATITTASFAGESQWNRRIERVGFDIDEDANTYNLLVEWRIELPQRTDTILDLSIDASLDVAGTPAAIENINVIVLPNPTQSTCTEDCGPPCNQIEVDGQLFDMHCDPASCDCISPTFTTAMQLNVIPELEDEVIVIFDHTDTALEDEDKSDDRGSFNEFAYVRAVKNIAFQPSPTDPDKTDLIIHWFVRVNDVTSLPINLDTIATVDGLPQFAVHSLTLNGFPGSTLYESCSSCEDDRCGRIYIDSVREPLFCKWEYQACATRTFTTIVPDLDLAPVQDIRIRLRAFDNAIPDLNDSQNVGDVTYGGWNRSRLNISAQNAEPLFGPGGGPANYPGVTISAEFNARWRFEFTGESDFPVDIGTTVEPLINCEPQIGNCNDCCGSGCQCFPTQGVFDTTTPDIRWRLSPFNGDCENVFQPCGSFNINGLHRSLHCASPGGACVTEPFNFHFNAAVRTGDVVDARLVPTVTGAEDPETSDNNGNVYIIADQDQDLAPDLIDECPDTPLGITINEKGRPIGDLNNDCNVSLTDFAIFQANQTGPR